MLQTKRRTKRRSDSDILSKGVRCVSCGLPAGQETKGAGRSSSHPALLYSRSTTLESLLSVALSFVEQLDCIIQFLLEKVGSFSLAKNNPAAVPIDRQYPYRRPPEFDWWLGWPSLQPTVWRPSGKSFPMFEFLHTPFHYAPQPSVCILDTANGAHGDGCHRDARRLRLLLAHSSHTWNYGNSMFEYPRPRLLETRRFKITVENDVVNLLKNRRDPL
jgi:hypothetical protein